MYQSPQNQSRKLAGVALEPQRAEPGVWGSGRALGSKMGQDLVSVSVTCSH